jgi:hypothetical protein
MSRIFDHKKQYACTEVFRLDELQDLVNKLDEEDFPTLEEVGAAELIRDFLKHLEEQEKRK